MSGRIYPATHCDDAPDPQGQHQLSGSLTALGARPQAANAVRILPDDERELAGELQVR